MGEANGFTGFGGGDELSLRRAAKYELHAAEAARITAWYESGILPVQVQLWDGMLRATEDLVPDGQSLMDDESAIVYMFQPFTRQVRYLVEHQWDDHDPNDFEFAAERAEVSAVCQLVVPDGTGARELAIAPPDGLDEVEWEKFYAQTEPRFRGLQYQRMRDEILAHTRQVIVVAGENIDPFIIDRPGAITADEVLEKVITSGAVAAAIYYESVAKRIRYQMLRVAGMFAAVDNGTA